MYTGLQLAPMKSNTHGWPWGVAKSEYEVAVNSNSSCLTSVNLSSKTVLSKKMPAPERQQISNALTIEALALVDGDDGKLYAVYATEQDQDITFVDVTTLDVTKIYSGNRNDYVSDFHISPDQRYLYFPSLIDAVCVWDLQNAEMCYILTEAKWLIDVMTVDMKIFVTITDDRNVRVWDVSQGLQPSAFAFKSRRITRMENGERVLVCKGQAMEERIQKEKPTLVKMVELDNPRYVLLKTKFDHIQYIKVLDVVTATIVRHIRLTMDVTTVCHIQGPRVLLGYEEQLCVVDVDKMELVIKFAGLLNQRSFATILNEGKEIATTTKGGHHLKLYDTATGKVTGIIKQDLSDSDGELKKLLRFKVSKDGSVGIAELKGGFFLIFDLVNRKFLRCIGESKLATEIYRIFSEFISVTDDGRYFLCLGQTRLGDMLTECIVIYDIQSDSVAKNVLDTQMTLKYTVEQSDDKKCSISQLCLLDNNTVVAAHDDFIIRVYSMQDGKLLHRLEGHREIPKLEIREDTPVFLSYVGCSEESSVRLWRKSDCIPVASLMMDTKIQGAMLLPGHSEEFLVVTEDSDTPVIFTVHGQKKQALLGNNTAPLASYPQLYEGIKKDSDLNSLLLADLDVDEDDPDTDTEDDSEDDDDSGSVSE